MLPLISGEFRVAYEPDLRYGQSGTAVLTMRVVASSRKKQDDGTWVDDKTLWSKAVAFGKLAENAAESIEKGDLIVITGHPHLEEWEQDGQKRSGLVILVDHIGPSLTFRTTPHGAQAGSRGPVQSAQSAQSAQPTQAVGGQQQQYPF